jgi:aminoglycoside phosphotransferase (APT) family kinase protein
MPPIAGLLRVVNQQHGTSFRLVGKLAGGTRGAYEVLDRDGRRAVLKPSANPAWIEQLRGVVRLVDHMRALGYPTPRFLCVGAAPDGTPYHVHEYVPGAPLSALAPAALDMVLAVVEQQADRSVMPERSWSSYVRDVVFAEGSGWTTAMRGHSAATADLLDAVEALTAPYADAALPTADVVHGDFHADHVIVHEGRVAGVIDFEAAGCGTRAIDLAVMLGWDHDRIDPAGRARLLGRIEEIAGRPGLAICLAYQVVNMAAYAVLHRPAAVRGAVARGWALLGEAGAAM